MKPVIFLTSARTDLRAENEYYRKIDPGLARRFQVSVEKAVRRISRQPVLMQAKSHGVRRWPVGDGFPHGVLYRNDSEEVVVLAVFHPSRDPAIWEGRLTEDMP